MPVSPITSSSPSLANLSSSTTSAAPAPSQSLNESDFLKLLSVEFQQQDPMQPMDDTAFIAQTAQFTSLQQMTQLSQQQALMTSTGYVGRTVTIQNNDGSQITGLVSAIDNSGTDPAVVINGTSYPLTAIKNIGAVGAPAASTPVSTTTPPASSTPTG